MSNKIDRILCPTDFTPASETAFTLALQFAKLADASVDVYHVHERSESNLETDRKLADLIAQSEDLGVSAKAVVGTGNIIDSIDAMAQLSHYSLMVIATHGAHGIRQNLFGADILKVLRKSGVASVVAQESSKRNLDVKRILLPIGSHSDYEDLVFSTCAIAQLCGAEVLFYSIQVEDGSLSEESLKNAQRAREIFSLAGVAYSEIQEDQNVYSFGFAKQTLMYAHSHDIDMIAMMPRASEEHAYFATADKERILTNPDGVLVLCSRGV
jgi:nucleotide-binding universal stress UspA family protein